MSGGQQTLGGGIAEERTRPDTMMKCPTCDEWVLRSRRHDHPHDLKNRQSVKEQQKQEEAEEKVPDHAKLSTQTYEVRFFYELEEVIHVEATDKSDAKRQAEHYQTYDGEVTHTLHTERRAIGDASAVSVEYLENNGLLPDDHDVTQDDILRSMGVDDGE